MIGVFKPVNNSHGYDIREFEIINGKPGNYKWLTISVYENELDKLPIFKPKIQCKDELEYIEQFKEYDKTLNKQINLF